PVSDPTPQLSDIHVSAWELQLLTVLCGFVFTPEEPGKYTLRFENDGRLRGQSDCNTFTGTWALEESLVVTEFSSSRSLCVPGSIHNYYALYLRAVNAMEWQGTDLVLRTPDEDVKLLFLRAP
ncbi:MAG: META domain-containing protein, partial [Gammaproteobacteria bacterium]